MIPDVHARACRLLDAELAEGISAADREWLEAHLSDCPMCQSRAGANRRALQTLRSFTMRFDPALVSTTQVRVRWRARQLQDEHVRMRALWISCGLSWLSGALTAPLLWQAIAWLGRHFQVSEGIWIIAFAACWLAPATVAGALIAWRRSRASETANAATPWERCGRGRENCN